MLAEDGRRSPLVLESGGAAQDIGGGDMGESVVALITLTL